MRATVGLLTLKARAGGFLVVDRRAAHEMRSLSRTAASGRGSRKTTSLSRCSAKRVGLKPGAAAAAARISAREADVGLTGSKNRDTFSAPCGDSIRFTPGTAPPQGLSKYSAVHRDGESPASILYASRRSGPPRGNKAAIEAALPGSEGRGCGTRRGPPNNFQRRCLDASPPQRVEQHRIVTPPCRPTSAADHRSPEDRQSPATIETP